MQCCTRRAESGTVGRVGHKVVDEEVALLRDVNARLETTSAPAAPSETSITDELEHLRNELRDGTKTEDRAALMQQWELGPAAPAPVGGATT